MCLQHVTVSAVFLWSDSSGEWAGCIPGEGCPPPGSKWRPGPWCAKIQVGTSDGTVDACLPLRHFPNLWHGLCQLHVLQEQTGSGSHLSKLVCAPSVYGLVFCLFGQCRPSRSCHMVFCRPLLPVGFGGCGLWDSPASAWGYGVAESRCKPSGGSRSDGWTQRGAWCTGSLPWLSVGPLMSWGEGWILATSSCSRAVRGTHCCSGPRQCAASPCLCRARMWKSCRPGSSRSCHSNLVCKTVVGGKVQVLVCVGFLSVHWCGQGPIIVVGDQSVQEREWPIRLLLHGELDRGFNRVEMVQEPIDLVFW